MNHVTLAIQKFARPTWTTGSGSLAWKPIIPFAIVNLLSAGVIGLLVMIAVDGQNKVAKNASIDLMGSVLAQMEQQLALVTRDHAYWDQAVDNLVTNVDMGWADINVGSYLYDTYRTHSSYVVDGHNQLVYSSLAGKRLLDDPTVRFSDGFQSLLNQARANAVQGKKPEPVIGYFRDEDRVLFVAATVLTTYQPNGDDSTAKPTGSVLIVTKNIDDVLLQEMGDSYGLPDLRLEADPANNSTDRTSLSLRFPNGQLAGLLTWQARSPGGITLRWLLPLIGVVFLLLAGIAAIFLYQTRKVVTALNLEATERGRITKELADAHSSLELRIEERTEELRSSRERFQGFAEAASDWLWELDADLRYTYVSPTVENHLGVTAASLLGCSTTEIDHGQFSECGRRILAEAARKRLPIHNLEQRHVNPSGEECLLISNCVPIFDEAGEFKGYRGTTRDITEQRRLEDALRQAQKMEAVGKLTGGVAHDFNNLLAVILGNIELLGDEIGDNRILATINRAGKRGAELTQRLLAFSRQQALQPKSIDLAELVPGLHDLLQGTLGEPIKIVTDIPVEIWPVTADPGQLEGALLNLSINARDAMPDGGILEIRCSNIELQGGELHVSDEVAAGDYVQIAVRDTGTGMLEDVLEHAFEPFYTTKDVGEGSGLGLSMVHGFARQSGGDAVIESTPGMGTEVRIFLPRSEVANVSDERTQDDDLKRGQGEVVLVLEDDPDVRALAVATLDGLGYLVLEAADANAAMQILEEEAGNVGLLLSDVVLPGGVSGQQVATKAKDIYPKLKIVFMTGYASGLDATDKIPEFGEALLNKPFRRADLAKVIHDTLTV